VNVGRFAALIVLLVACSSDAEVTVPVKPAPASRHDALRDGLLADSAAADATSGPAIAYLAHGAHPAAPSHGIGTIDVALGTVEYEAATGDRSQHSSLDLYIESVDTADYGQDTVTTARLALLEVEVTRLLGEDRRAHAIAHDDAIRAKAFGDFADPVTNRATRAYAASPDSPVVSGPANVAMLTLKCRLFRLTKDETYRLEARSIYAALQSYVPATLDEEADLAFATSLLFEITGEDRFITATDATFDAIASRRGGGFTAACPGCAFHALWALGYRRGLAGEAY
jgi:hypothetical protein